MLHTVLTTMVFAAATTAMPMDQDHQAADNNNLTARQADYPLVCDNLNLSLKDIAACRDRLRNVGNSPTVSCGAKGGKSQRLCHIGGVKVSGRSNKDVSASCAHVADVVDTLYVRCGGYGGSAQTNNKDLYVIHVHHAWVIGIDGDKLAVDTDEGVLPLVH